MSKKLRPSDAKDTDQPVIKTDIDGHITYLILIETMDGLYTPIGLELPMTATIYFCSLLLAS